MFYEFLKNSSLCQGLPGLLQQDGMDTTIAGEAGPAGVQPNLQNWQIILLMIGLGIFTALIAKSFNWIRQHVYKDKVQCSVINRD